MRRLATLVGGLTLAGSLVGGAVYVVEQFLPEQYEVETARGADVIYNRDGETFVHSDPENMLTYLLQEDPDRVRHALAEVKR
ncbi:hypothetical protein HN592_04330 [Candidatus Woesearchaeota archaeon]|jgi:hypothetical protein|nr:hypothetical protein [Candidatus Woesearchaeota archaeon]MBT4368440.1 hypothetical protein [Candidatus Woesearchaeota archaeon]MBT4712929.1 hypothetical protein [Candidatus Woesearchaeota archaeon]MBT6639841.1 hypothetical protein [Candidatus Woesearchaeota archaeon]MBT7134013.1 hypothetical protein [Candidatus Woesearchaeota archaeon]